MMNYLYNISLAVLVSSLMIVIYITLDKRQ